MKHFPDCKQMLNAKKDAEALAAFDAAVERYKTTWPNYCKKCRGWGGHTHWDRDIYGEDFDPCAHCYDLEKCPRCSEKLFFNKARLCGEEGGLWPRSRHPDHSFEQVHCTSCNWHEDKPGMPDWPPTVSECECWGRIYEQEYKERMRSDPWW